MPSQKEIWNEIASQWKEYRKKPFEFVSDFLKDKSGKILDLGCGSGRHFSCIKGEIFALDFSSEMLKHAQQTAKTLKIKPEFFDSVASKLPFKNNFFDSAIYINALHCIENKEDRSKSLTELFRVLKPGAQAIISVWGKNQNRIKGKSKDQLIPWTKGKEKFLRYYYIYDKAEFESLLKEKGLNIIKIKEEDNLVATIQKPS